MADISPETITALQAMRKGDWGYDDIQKAAREALKAGDKSIYAKAVEKWLAEKPAEG